MLSKVVSKSIKKSIPIRSFSPEINRKITQLREDDPQNIFMCLDMHPLKGVPKVNVTVGGKGKCLKYTNPRAQQKLLDNLTSKFDLDCNNIVAPKQVLANCWFNTFFMAFFISDKGRKFFRFFRRLMIKGEKIDGTPITPPLLTRSFFMLNMAIEASLNYNDHGRLIALQMNTNDLIKDITRAITTGANKKGMHIKPLPKQGKWGNPLTYYRRIIQYLGDNSIRFSNFNVNSNFFILRKTGNWHKSSAIELIEKHRPEVFTVEISDHEKYVNKRTSFTIDEKDFKAEYKLDSVIIRDTKKQHFCSVITCNGQEFGFDGASFARIAPFKWKRLLNKDENWSFEGSGSMKWNFTRGYMILFYYRTK